LTLARLPERAEIVAAFDNDESGRMLVNMVRLAWANVVSKIGTSLSFLVHLPTQAGEDWNDVLQRGAPSGVHHVDRVAAEYTEMRRTNQC
jgi:hypothetical protein